MADHDPVTLTHAPQPAPVATGAFHSPDSASELVRVLDQYLADLQGGKAPNREDLLAGHPDLAQQLDQCLAGMEFIHQAARKEGAPNQLGDFKILREIGRGGMGVVYEAEQVSLKRKVALKVLRFGAVADAEAMQRFQREAETVARLHHTNIVPVFAVGCENGVNYYAMQFIEGKSLSDVVSPRREQGHSCENRPLLALRANMREIAHWGLQAAEALAHAHQRGVIHRDIKPSNLLLDTEGVLWLTDFGLAKRADEVTMTATGLLLGTPRYMSPEQASTVKQPIDHRTDIYSLGATLYELATGQPVFSADTPQGVITQILSAEPVPPRRLQGNMPRDLETIILKCLSKEPGRRYSSAQALSKDLRSFLDGQPIQARRPSLVERAARWARKHKKSTTIAGVAAAAAMLLVVAGLYGWTKYRQAQLGRLSLTTSGPHLFAEVLDDQDNPVVPGFPVPTSEPVALPAGSYRLRLSSSGLLSETWPLDIGKGEETSYPVYLRHQWPWPPMESGSSHRINEMVDLAGHTDLIVIAPNEKFIRRVDGATGKPVWPADFVFSEKNIPPGQERFTPYQAKYDWTDFLLYSMGRDQNLVQPSVDLDGDGTRDLVLASGRSPSLLAISGKDSKVLWWHHSTPPPPAGLDRAKLKIENMGHGSVMGRPGVFDVDGDGVSDFVACFNTSNITFAPPGAPAVYMPTQSWLAAVSGKTGNLIWDYSTNKWFGLENNSSHIFRTNRLCRPTLVRLGEKYVVAMAAGNQLLLLDPATGKETQAPQDLGFRPESAPSWTDCDGDGFLDAVLLSQTGEEPQTYDAKRNIAAWSPIQKKLVWQIDFRPSYQSDPFQGGADPTLFLSEDLNGDGRAEIIAADGRYQHDWNIRIHRNWFGKMTGEATTSQALWTGLTVLDSGTGQPRWLRKLAFTGQGSPPDIRRYIAGSDLDGDGWRDVFAAWVGIDQDVRGHVLHVQALSGADGRTLWRWRTQVGNVQSPDFINPLKWGQVGEDGWPLLIVSQPNGPGGQHTTFLFAASTGRLAHTLPEVLDPKVADCTGDGIPDLCYTVSPQGAPRFMVLQGMPPEPWRRLGTWLAAKDYDGDGFDDFVQSTNQGLTIRSGKDGRFLWYGKARPPGIRGMGDTPLFLPMPEGDLDGDGSPDIVHFDEAEHRDRQSHHSIRAWSGKDGRLLWFAEDFGMSSANGSGGINNYPYRYPSLAWADLDGDGRAEILAVTGKNDSAAIHLTALTGHSGKPIWSVPILHAGFEVGGLTNQLLDLNGDGVRDLVVWQPADVMTVSFQGPTSLMAFSGRDGKPLWSNLVVPKSANLLWPRPVVGDIDGDGVPEIVIGYQNDWDNKAGGHRNDVQVFDGKDGKHKWTWSWQSGNAYTLPPLLVDFDGTGKKCVCLGIWQNDQNGNQIVILSETGQVRQRFAMRSGNSFGREWWNSADLDGDGKEELLFKRIEANQEEQLWACRGKEDDVLWKWRLPGAGEILEIQPSTKGKPATVVAWTGQTVYGLAGNTGQPAWRCEVTGAPSHGSSHDPKLNSMKAGDVLGLPRFVYQWPGVDSYNWHTVARQAWPTLPSGAYQPPGPTPSAYPVLDDSLPPFPLPWATRSLSLFPVLGSVAFVGLGVYWIIKGRRRMLLFQGIVTLIAILFVPNIGLWPAVADLKDPDQAISWKGWYWILPEVLWFALCMLLALMALKYAGTFLRRGFRRLRKARIEPTSSVG